MSEITVDRYGPPDRPDYEVGLNGEHIYTFTAAEAEELYVQLGRVVLPAREVK